MSIEILFLYILPNIIILIGVFFLVAKFLEGERDKLSLILRQELLKENQKISLPIRYQAYERIILFLERMHPVQLIARNPATGMSAIDYKDKLIIDTNTEYQYNITQQIYVSADIWKLILQVKKQIQVMFTEIALALPEGATDYDFIVAVHQYINDVEEDKFPIQVGLKYLKNEVSQIH